MSAMVTEHISKLLTEIILISMLGVQWTNQIDVMTVHAEQDKKTVQSSHRATQLNLSDVNREDAPPTQLSAINMINNYPLAKIAWPDQLMVIADWITILFHMVALFQNH